MLRRSDLIPEINLDEVNKDERFIRTNLPSLAVKRIIQSIAQLRGVISITGAYTSFTKTITGEAPSIEAYATQQQGDRIRPSLIEGIFHLQLNAQLGVSQPTLDTAAQAVTSLHEGPIAMANARGARSAHLRSL